MPSPSRTDSGCALWALLLVSCASETAPPPPEPGTGGMTAAEDCYRCHGDEENRNNAPPPAIWRQTAIPDPHQQHLQGSTWRNWIDCEDCHLVPESIRDEGHNDGRPAELTWSGLAVADGATPAYDFDSQTCSGGYCHGATLTAGAAAGPLVWTEDGSRSECGTGCHQNPPPTPHPAVEACHQCHSEVVDDEEQIKAPLLHIDGHISVDEMECNDCHGGGTDPDEPVNWAPPLDVTGNSATSFRGVGAHQSHLQAGDVTVAIACTECHTVPTHWGDAGHYDSALPAELTFGSLATSLGSSPSWNGSTCTTAYCHRPNPSDSAATFPIPVWTSVNGTFNACDACHGYPPVTATHPPFLACGMSTCHDAVVATDHVTITNKALHVNGIVE